MAKGWRTNAQLGKTPGRRPASADFYCGPRRLFTARAFASLPGRGRTRGRRRTRGRGGVRAGSWGCSRRAERLTIYGQSWGRAAPGPRFRVGFVRSGSAQAGQERAGLGAGLRTAPSAPGTPGAAFRAVPGLGHCEVPFEHGAVTSRRRCRTRSVSAWALARGRRLLGSV